ncbi:hypothetical protein GT348_01560 [Aristophania vespae]|uniref:DUF1311 domain-containing protein n=1 Tax=Aristophania vespae TaxID=2697033 RepID=A0A6P1NE11_9PROT|nr:hypothetical protein [Aristophania vespae]QHI95147.1 hypothetical protein GT348_01560 [Aristophania vespae]
MSSMFRALSFSRLAAIITLVGSFAASSPTQAAVACHPPKDVHAAFNVVGLKSELMVTALSCQAQDRYNEFVTHFKSDLNNSEKRLERYFKATYGRRARQQHDAYITQLADVQSLGGLKSGTVFCDQRVPMFNEINALDNADDLAHYAEAKDIVQPSSYESCTAPRAKKTRRHVVRRRRHK